MLASVFRTASGQLREREGDRVITVTRLNGQPIIINADLIEMIEVKPNTVLILSSGKKMVVSETPEQVVQLVVDYKRDCHPFVNYDEMEKVIKDVRTE